MTVPEILTNAISFLQSRVVPWTNKVLDDVVSVSQRPTVPTFLLSGIYLKLSEMVESLSIGSHYYNILPVSLTAANGAQLIVDIQPQGRLRKVSIWADAASGGPLPTLRISKNASGTSSGGIRISPGEVSELGEVPANVKLYAAATQALVLYVIERG